MQKPSLPHDAILFIEGLDHEARGIGRLDGKVAFVEGALPGETVSVRYTRRKSHFDQAFTVQVLNPGPSRTTPRCTHFGVCGGCNMQHADPAAQIAFKQRVLEDNLARIGRVKPDTLLPTLQGPAWGYRHRARISVRNVVKKESVLVGFHEKGSSFVADMHRCHIMAEPVGNLIDPLRELMMSLDVKDQMPQIEVAVGEDVTVLVFRILEMPSEADQARMRAFADKHNVQIWFQSKGPDTATPFHPAQAPELNYTLPEFDVVMPFGPTEFTQVNPAINRSLVGRVVRLLNPQKTERVGDFFCGLGNFTLPLARSGAQVLGVEGSAALVARAMENAARNSLTENTEFRVANLFAATEESLLALGKLDKLLIDPPRDGALEVVKSLGGKVAPQRIVYVSCNPKTLARDVEILCHQAGYRLSSAGIINMFPHTSHVESMAVFNRP